MFRNAERTGIILLVLLLCQACSQARLADDIPATGELAGESFSARMDSELARYYLEEYPDPHPLDWHLELAAHEAAIGTGVMSQAYLASVADRHQSLDLSALLFIRHVLADQENRAWQSCLIDTSRGLRDGSLDREALLGVDQQGSPNYKVVFAPGWLYRDNPQTEADFARTRRSLDEIGLPYHFVETLQDGTVEENAEQLAEAIREYRDRDLQLIVVSASKSASEVMLAVGGLLAEEERTQVAAWINAGGVIGGTPLADHWTAFPRSLLARMAFLWYGWDYGSLQSMRTDRAASRLETLSLPEDLLVVNYVAVPMRAQVSEPARDRHALLGRRYGPNDGLAPLWHAKVSDGITVLEPGADHYFLSVDLNTRTLALTAMILAELEGQGCPAGNA